MVSTLIVLHGGSWKNNTYEGGIKDYIPLPCGGISYTDLVSKLEVRLKKDKTMYTFDIDAIVNSQSCEIIRIKVTDELEWQFLMDMAELPTLYVSTYPISSSILTHNEEFIGTIIVPPLNRGIETCTSMSNCGSSPWVIPGVANHASVENDESMIPYEPVDSVQLMRGSLFPSKDFLISAIHAHHLKNRLEFRTPLSCKKKLHVVCKHSSSCNFSLRVKSLGTA